MRFLPLNLRLIATFVNDVNIHTPTAHVLCICKQTVKMVCVNEHDICTHITRTRRWRIEIPFSISLSCIRIKHTEKFRTLQSTEAKKYFVEFVGPVNQSDFLPATALYIFRFSKSHSRNWCVGRKEIVSLAENWRMSEDSPVLSSGITFISHQHIDMISK